MAQTSAEWLEGQSERSFARQRAQVDTAKIIATFTAGVAATLVATALQVGAPTTLDRVASYFLMTSVVATVCVVLLDRIVEADQATVLQNALVNSWSDSEILTQLRLASIAATNFNEDVVRYVRWSLAVQLCISAVAGIVAAISLLS
jgi:hypothetical protein